MVEVGGELAHAHAVVVATVETEPMLCEVKALSGLVSEMSTKTSAQTVA
ncbi:MAG TPA: hypothetical protein VFP84_06645 [Kofleriaceae bacterium]|nr:hypothetical protein [Kofleriaceae bacterium]